MSLTGYEGSSNPIKYFKRGKIERNPAWLKGKVSFVNIVSFILHPDT
jgi:hypothetical protein